MKQDMFHSERRYFSRRPCGCLALVISLVVLIMIVVFSGMTLDYSP